MMLSRRNCLLLLGSLCFSGRIFSQDEIPKYCDVLVIGSGVAGLSAAISAKRRGGSVCLIEKGAILGGHSLVSSGSIAAVDLKRQRSVGVEDSIKRFVEDAWRIGGECGNKDLLTRIATESSEALKLLENEGVKFGPVFQATAGLHPRAFATIGPAAGRTYVVALAGLAVRLGVGIYLSTVAVDIKHTPNQFQIVVESRGQHRLIKACRVVIATGGFTANHKLRQLSDPRLTSNLKTSANPNGLLWDGATGDGLLLAMSIGAARTYGMGVQLVPFGGGRLLDYAGGDIYLNDNGKRFVNEAASRSVLTDAILELQTQQFWVVTDSQSYKGATLGSKLLSGVVHKSNSIEEMAIGMGVRSDVLRRTLVEYNEGALKKEDKLFGKTVFTQTIDKPPFYWGRDGIYVHTTLDGLITDDKARVLDVDGKVIPNLYAAGEVVGGIFGRDRLGGAMLTNCLVMGKIAGC